MRNKHQKKTPNTKKKKNLLVAVIVVVLAAGVGLGLWLWQKKTNQSVEKNTSTTDIRPQNTVDYSPAKPEDNQATDNAKNDPKNYGTLDDTTSDVSFSVVVTGANPDQSARLLRVSTLVNGVSEGSCKLILSQSGQTDITATNGVTTQNNSYYCPVFNIPFDQFPTGGEWQVKVEVTSDSKTSTGEWQGGAVNIQK